MVPFAVVKDNIFVTKSFVDQKRFFSVPLGDGQTAVGLVHFLRDRSKEVLFLYRVLVPVGISSTATATAPVGTYS